MRRMITGLFVILAASGCKRSNLYLDPDDLDATRQRLLAAIPVGTSSLEGQGVLTREDFRCEGVVAGDLPGVGYVAYIPCWLVRSEGLDYTRRWDVSIVHDLGTVRDVRVATLRTKVY